MGAREDEHAALVAHGTGQAKPALFDPSEHTVAEVLAYLGRVRSDDEFQRVLDLEAEGKNRSSIAEA